jgi:hypothetical protein
MTGDREPRIEDGTFRLKGKKVKVNLSLYFN